MAEGFDPSDAPVRRGRRDPELALALSAGIDTGDEQGGDEGGEFGLMVGDELVYKMTEEVPNPITGKDRWFTYGIKTTVKGNETEEMAFTRIVTLVNGRLGESIEYADAVAAEAEAERRKAPIVPQR